MNMLQEGPTENEIVNSTAPHRKLKRKINFSLFFSNCTNRNHIVGAVSAINCTSNRREFCSPDNLGLADLKFRDAPEAVRHLINHSLSDATKRAYRDDLAHYEGTGRYIPSTPEMIAEYLAECCGACATATIQRRVAALAKAHAAIGADDPTKNELVRATMRGIRRAFGTAQRQAKPILREDLFAILDRMGDRPIDLRDKALLLIGFAGAFRRSELVGLEIADTEYVRQGIILKLRRSKTDQEGFGRKIGIPFGRTRWCPVRHLMDWVAQTGIVHGPLFRSVTKGGKVSDSRLSSEAVCLVVKRRMHAAGYDPTCFSGHSLRAGLATSAAIAGAQTWKIRQQTGHASDAMLGKYIRDGELFSDNVSGLVL